MIFYGTNGKHYATLPLTGTHCPACAAPEALQVGLVGRYAHVYGIPLFPYQRIAITQCLRCQASWTDQRLPPALAPGVRAAKKQRGLPLWMWSGLGLVLAVMLFGYLQNIRDARTDEDLLAAPHAGDIYTVHSDSSNQYSLLKVRQVGGNVVELVANEYQTDDPTPINSLNAPFRYGKQPFTLTLLDLQIMRRKGQLTDVDRMAE